jgi:RNA polymerase sigma factor (sigma-70 family)
VNTIDPVDHLKLAQKMAWKYKGITDLEFEDVLSICYLAMVKAAEKYDPEKGYAWSTYASKAMYFAILNERDRRKSVQNTISLESLGRIDSGGKQQSWESFIPNLTVERTEDSIIDKIMMENIADRLPRTVEALRNFKGGQREKAAAIMFIRNPHLTQQQIAEKIGISQVSVSRGIAKIKRQLQEQLAM